MLFNNFKLNKRSRSNHKTLSHNFLIFIYFSMISRRIGDFSRIFLIILSRNKGEDGALCQLEDATTLYKWPSYIGDLST